MILLRLGLISAILLSGESEESPGKAIGVCLEACFWSDREVELVVKGLEVFGLFFMAFAFLLEVDCLVEYCLRVVL